MSKHFVLVRFLYVLVILFILSDQSSPYFLVSSCHRPSLINRKVQNNDELCTTVKENDVEIESQKLYGGSVHLKIHQDTSDAVENFQPDTGNSSMIDIVEYVSANNISDILLAAIGEADSHQLELFSIHKFATNYSNQEGVLLRRVREDFITNNAQKHVLPYL